MEQSSDEPQVHSAPAGHKVVPEGIPAAGMPLLWARTTTKINSFLAKWGRPPAIEFSDSYLESVQANLWAVSPEREWYMFRRPKVFIAGLAGVGLILFAAVLAQPSTSDSARWWALVVTVGGTSSLIY
ncbi:hypothetical protein [Pseudarthrobacter sulfonivorans]|uniref:hypothetical protein n=1 Tax=Pseudarthrobacter sulfonivorans TaxID=121292 RepID=UPI00285DCD41|nr:hypothetical protein [Pseudarthrobacter sulfonivorans]MDR6414921.1 hypothetical protein [Pseudarthrobacter sulfonivorans]